MKELPGKESVWLDSYKKNEFEIAGRDVTVIRPKKTLRSLPWAWKGEFLDAFPGTELALLEQGYHIVYLEHNNMFGAPEVVAEWNELYELLTTQYGFARKTALIGLSRGGLYCYQWAIANPEKVACVYGDAPVCDMRSWPGGKRSGDGSPEEWKSVKKVFGFSSESEAMEWKGNPVDNLAKLAENNVPILHVYGDADTVVPWEENTGVVDERYKKLGGDISLIGKPGCGHHPHGLDDPTPIVDFIMKHTE